MNKPKTVDEFNDLVAAIRADQGYKAPLMYVVAVTGEQDSTIKLQESMVNVLGENPSMAVILTKMFEVPVLGIQQLDLTKERLEKVLEYFEPFKGDGKRHYNLEVLQTALERGRNAVVFFAFS